MDEIENKYCRFCGHEVKIRRMIDYNNNEEKIIRECFHCQKATVWESKKRNPAKGLQ
jgi:endogenous inhibitor of DNA gyrase (YacG/DUF329 family)